MEPRVEQPKHERFSIASDHSGTSVGKRHTSPSSICDRYCRDWAVRDHAGHPDNFDESGDLLMTPRANEGIREEQSSMGSETDLRLSESDLASVFTVSLAEREESLCWKVCPGGAINIRRDKSENAEKIGEKGEGCTVRGREEDGWLALCEEPGFMLLHDRNGPLLEPCQERQTECEQNELPDKMEVIDPALLKKQPMQQIESQDSMQPRDAEMQQSKDGTLIRFLPKTVNGKVVLKHEGGDRWRVDNSQLKWHPEALGYRNSKHLTDMDQGAGIRFGSVVEGVDEGEWLKVKLQKAADETTQKTIVDIWRSALERPGVSSLEALIAADIMHLLSERKSEK